MALRRLLTTRMLLKPLKDVDHLRSTCVRTFTTDAFQQGSAFSIWSSLLFSTSQSWPLAVRPLSTGVRSNPEEAEVKAREKERSGTKSLMVEEEDYDAITDKIPEKPMTAAEGVSYTAIILAAFAVLGACLWAFVSNYIWDPVEYTCFNITLEKLRADPRVTVRVGDVIKGYGSDSMNRHQRRMIRNRQYKDANGREHTQIQFNIKGSSGVGIVYADMFRDDFKKWQYAYLYVDIPERGKNALQRLAIITPPI